MATRRRFYLRNPAAIFASHADGGTFLVPGRPPLSLEGVDSGALSLFFAAAAAPLAETEARRHLDAGALALLVEKEVLLAAARVEELEQRVPSPRDAKKPCRHLVLGVSGAINAAQIVPLVGYLNLWFAERLDVVLTEAACRFVRPEVFGHLGVRAWVDPFEGDAETNVPHISLAAAAELVAVLPASAHTIHKLATGACSDLLSLLVTGTRAPVVVAPSMNIALWENPVVAKNIDTLREHGVHILEPGVGYEAAQGQKATPMFGAMQVDPEGIARLLTVILKTAGSKPR